MSSLAIAMKESEASLKQAASATAAAEQLLKQETISEEEKNEEEKQKQVNASNEIKELKEGNFQSLYYIEMFYFLFCTHIIFSLKLI